MATKKLSAVVIDALEDIKARDIKLINVSKLTSVFDYIAVASADSTRQTKALAKNVMDKVKESGGWIYGTEGEQSGEWVLVDCGDVVVHIMQPVIREHYKLEELWGEGKLEYPKPVAPKRSPAVAVEKPKAKTTTKPKATKPKTTKATTTKAKSTKKSTKAKTGTAVTTAKTSKVKKTVAKVAKKKTVAKAAATVSKKVSAATVKKTAVKKPAAKKPAAKKPVPKKPAAIKRKTAA